MGDDASRHSTVRRIDGEYGIRQPAGTALTIEYLLPVLEQIRGWAADGYRALAHGGLEVGGVLFGRHNANLVQITAARPLKSEHAFGPGFVLSERDETALKELIDLPTQDPDLAGLEPVGWYRSRTRAEALLTDRDLRLHATHFPQGWQLVLVVRPDEGAAMRATFFSRNAEGSFSEQSGSGEFTVEPRPAPPKVVELRPEPQRAAAVAVSGREPATLEPERPTSAPPAAFAPAFASNAEPVAEVRVHGWLLAAAALLALAVGFGAGSWYASPKPATVPPTLGLRVHDSDGQLLVTWERAAAVLEKANRAVLEFVEPGGKTEARLDPAALRSGTFTYVRRAERVDIGLTVYPVSGQPIQEYASFLGRVGPDPAAELKRERDEAIRARDEALRRQRDTAADQSGELRRTVQSQAARIRELEEAVRVLRRRAQVEENLRRRR